jgi:Tfp pilus assembly protein PilX
MKLTVPRKSRNGESLMKRNSERGSALVFSLILVLVLSVMAASLMFLARSETWSGMNYRMMTQARYGAEAGVNAAANFLMSTAYVPPAAPAGGAFAGFNTSVYPVTDIGGNPIYLSTLKGQPANYPNAAMQTAFAGNVNGNLQAGSTTVKYTASAQLMSMVSIIPFGTTTPMTIQTWQITAHGDISSVQNAEAEVVTTLERYISPAFAYAAFADGNGCAQLSFTGNGQTDSYDSGNLTVSGGVIQPPTGSQILTFGGNVGTNGNQTDSGSQTTVNGTLSTPNAGTGVCSSGNMTALTGSSTQVTGGLVQLPSPVTYPTPTDPPPGTTNITMSNGTQTLGPCNVTPCSYGDIVLNGGSQTNPTILSLTPGVYDINSLSISGNAEISLAPDPITGQYGTVIINVAGNNNTTPIAIAGNAINNPTYDPSLIQITYAGTGTVQIAGNGACAAVVYAPNAIVDFKGNGAFYGSVIANQILDVGNGNINYDLRLKKKLFTVGNYVLNTFTWNKY